MTEFTEKERLRIKRSLASAPALPLVEDYYGRYRNVETFVDLIGLLDAYFVQLSTLFKNYEARENDHRRLVNDVAAMKRVLGIVAEEREASDA